MRWFTFYNNLKFRTKLLLSYFSVVLLSIILIGYILVARMTETYIDQINEINRITFQQTKNNISVKLAGYIHISNTILSDSRLIGYLQHEYKSDSDFMYRYIEYIRSYPSRFLLNNPQNVTIRIFTTNHTVLSDRSFIFKIKDTQKQEQWYQDILHARGLNTIRGVYVNEYDRLVFSIGRILNFFSSQKFTSVLLIEIPERELYDLLEKEDANKDVYIIDAYGYVVTSTQRDHIGMNTDDLSNLNEIVRGNNGVQEAYVGKDHILYARLEGENAFRDWMIISIFYSSPLIQDTNRIVRESLFICTIIVFLSLLPISFFANNLTKGLRQLVNNMDRIKDEKFDVFINYKGNDEISELSRSFKNMIERIDTLIHEVYKYEISLKDLQIKTKEVELNALQSQIHPHFMFNVMESICMNLMKKGETEISNVLQNFAHLLRRSIDYRNDGLTMGQELDLAEHYLKIQKFRYRDKFEYEIEIHGALYEMMIPKFIIQPIIENAIYHGIEMKEESGLLKISSQITEDMIIILVEDDGVGIV